MHVMLHSAMQQVHASQSVRSVQGVFVCVLSTCVGLVTTFASARVVNRDRHAHDVASTRSREFTS